MPTETARRCHRVPLMLAADERGWFEVHDLQRWWRKGSRSMVERQHARVLAAMC